MRKKIPQILSTKEVELLLDQPKCVDLKGYRDKAMLELLYATGIRVTELINLSLSVSLFKVLIPEKQTFRNELYNISFIKIT